MGRSVQSILRQPTFGQKKNRRRFTPKFINNNKNTHNHDKNKNSDRRITWNEEVEELVILDCSSEEYNECNSISTPQHDQFATIIDQESVKENIDPLHDEQSSLTSQSFRSNIPDPYDQPSLENTWFGTKSTLGGMKKTNKLASFESQPSSLSAKTEADSLEAGPVTFNFNSLDDSNLTIIDSSNSVYTPRSSIHALDDSLVEILDAPMSLASNFTPSPTPAVSFTASEITPKMKPSSLTERIQEDMQQRIISNHVKEQEKKNNSPNMVHENTFVVGGNKRNNNHVKINVRTYQKEPSSTKMNKISSSSFTPNNIIDSEASATSEKVDLFQLRESVANELDPEDFSIGTRSTVSTWKNANDSSFGPTNDCAAFGSAKDCMFPSMNSGSSTTSSNNSNDCGTIDLAKGFQATLSNFINAAVTDMKEGLSTLKGKWEENVPKFSENGENPFLLNSFELDAMMDILKVEMDHISPSVDNMKPFNGDCGAEMPSTNFRASCS